MTRNKIINPGELHSIELYTSVSFLTVICPISTKFKPQYGDINQQDFRSDGGSPNTGYLLGQCAGGRMYFVGNKLAWVVSSWLSYDKILTYYFTLGISTLLSM